MKKNLVFVAMAATLLVACSQDDRKIVEDNDPLKIRLTAGAPGTFVQTKSIGTVGDIEGNANNKWNDQTIYVYALSKTDKTIVLDEVGVKLENKKATAHADNTLTWADGIDPYFPIDNNAYNFYAYHVDDAATMAADVPQVQKDVNNDLYLQVKINGAQDLMTGKAVLTDVQKQALQTKWEEKHSGSTATAEILDAEYGKAFSAYTARRGVQPVVQFKHVLTRFVFNVLPGIADANLVSIDSLGVESATAGKLYFALDKASEDSIALDESVENEILWLKQRGVDGIMTDWALDEYTPAEYVDGATQTPTLVGESLMVMPKEGIYTLVIKLSQVINGVRKYFSYNAEIPFPDGKTAFEAGNSYTVNLTVYGLQKVDITTNLIGWKDGGSSSIDQDNF